MVHRVAYILILHRAGFFSAIQPLHRRYAIVLQQLQPTQSPDAWLTARGILAWARQTCLKITKGHTDLDATNVHSIMVSFQTKQNTDKNVGAAVT